RLFTDFETFFSNFLAVPAPPAVTVLRSVGRMTLNQTVPVTSVGGMVTWSKGLAGTHFFTAGVDWRWVEGESQEDALDATRGATVITNRFAGGSQQSQGVFVQDVITPVSKLVLTLSARLDHW